MRPEIELAARKIAEGNPWYTADQIAGQREGVYRHNMRLRYAYANRMLKQLRIPVQGKTVVDIGCGDGQWSMEISRYKPSKIVGVDYNELRLQRYQQHVPGAEARFGSCLEMPLPDNFADVALFHQVLEHIPEVSQALAEVRRILKPDGWLIMSVPNEGTWLKQSVQYKFIQPSALKTTDHVNFFTQDSLAKALRQAQFRVDLIDSMGFYFPHNGISRHLLANKTTFKIGIRLAGLLPVLHDCLFAYARPIKAQAES